MLITLTITCKNQQKKIDIQVDNKQRICETLKVLTESGTVNYMDIDLPIYIKSQRTGEKINSFLSYAEAEIFTGDNLEII